jgi:hypothetical protein
MTPSSLGHRRRRAMPSPTIDDAHMFRIFVRLRHAHAANERRRPYFLATADTLEIRRLMSITTITFDDMSPGSTPGTGSSYSRDGVNFDGLALVGTQILTPENPYNPQTFPAHSGTQLAYDELNVDGGATGEIYAFDSKTVTWGTVGGYITPRFANPVTMTAYDDSNHVIKSVTTVDGVLGNPPPQNQLLQINANDIAYVTFKTADNLNGVYPLVPQSFSLDDFFFSFKTALPNITLNALPYSSTTYGQEVTFRHRDIHGRLDRSQPWRHAARRLGHRHVHDLDAGHRPPLDHGLLQRGQQFQQHYIGPHHADGHRWRRCFPRLRRRYWAKYLFHLSYNRESRLFYHCSL